MHLNAAQIGAYLQAGCDRAGFGSVMEADAANDRGFFP